MAEGDETRGLYAKYFAFKVRNPEAPGGEFDEPVTDQFFLLKFKDPHARRALMVYAMSVQGQFPQLAHDIRVTLHEIEPLTFNDYYNARVDYRHRVTAEFEDELAKSSEED